MEPSKPIHVVQCARCTTRIETYTTPGPKINAFLCNNCHLKWKDIETRLIGHAYQDEMRKAFIDFVNDLAHLRNHTLRGL